MEDMDFLVRIVGVEPTRIAPQEPKSCASANSAISAYEAAVKNGRFFVFQCGFPRAAAFCTSAKESAPCFIIS
jgi:hypothetical protein